jgi:hypothetical protein
MTYMWTVEYLLPAADERASLPLDMRARLQRMVETIQLHGLLALPRDWVKPLGDKLWELRVTGRTVLPAPSISRQRVGAWWSCGSS